MVALENSLVASESPKRVLMVFREGHDTPANVMIEQGVQAKLGELGGSDVEIYTEYLDDNRFGSVSHHGLYREYLLEKYRERRPDVILTTTGYSTVGLSHNDLIPGIPVVFIWASTTPASLPISSPGTNITGIVAYFDYRGTLDLILQVQPETHRIVVIGGVASSDRSMLGKVEKTSLLYSNRVNFEFWTNQPLAELLAGVNRLPSDTVVLYTIIFRDATGRAFVPAKALELLIQKASVPVFVFVDSQLGSGAVGGALVSYERLGTEAGGFVGRILDGESAANLPIKSLTNGVPTFDWRALQRWGISESRLPPGSVIQYRQPTFWQLYWGRVMGVMVLCGLQTALIIGLCVNRKQRRELENAAALIANISSRFINLPPSQVDQAIESAQRQICDALGLDLSSVWQWSGKTPGMITLTHLYRPLGGPPLPELMEAERHFPWCLSELKAGRVISLASLNEAPAEAARDQEAWRHYGVKSVLTFPLSTGEEKLVGALSFSTTRQERTWPDAIVNRLQVVAQIFTNALARIMVDQELRESEARLSLAADSAEAGMWVLNCATGVFWVTERARAIFGFAPDEEISMKRFEALVHPEDIASVRKTIEECLVTHEPIDLEYRVQVNNVCVKWICSRGRPYFKPTGEPERLMGVSIDITERKRAEQALKESYAEIRSLKDRLQAESDYLKAEIKLTQSHGEVIGKSTAIRQVLNQVEQVAATDSSVLICGETGTGKELVAQAIHRLSQRKNHVMVKVNCAALPSALVESELFGREKGAFTGALARQVGRFEVADGSTIFLDEVGELPLEVQAKLLRVLQEGQFERLGSPRTISVNVRVLAATNRDLAAEVGKGRFREDLYYRLNVFPIRVPPLRERTEDIPLMVWAFLEEFSSRMGKKITQVSRKTMEALQRHPWPGNVRELRNVIEHAAIVTSGNTLKVPLLAPDAPTAQPPQTLADSEREHILKVLEQTGWRIKGPKGAATLLGLNPSTLYSRMEKLGVPSRREKKNTAD